MKFRIYLFLLLTAPILLSAQTNPIFNQIGPDIDGEAADDLSGNSVSLSSDGMTIAIGAPQNDGNGTSSGHVRIYSWDGNSWNQLGNDIDGEAAGDYSGISVSLSSDGMTIAIGAPNNDGNGSNSGHVRVYSWDGSSWNQLGNDIDGEAADNLSGHSVSLSSDGMTVAIGAVFNNGNGSNSGHVRVYSWDGSSWNQLGNDIDGEAAYDISGNSVSLSSDGMTVAIGAYGNGNNSGHVRIYSWDGSSWNQLGNDIDGEAAGDYSGISVSLSSDGMTIAIGAMRNNGNGFYSGHVRVYSWDGSSWNQIGNDIYGEAAYDLSGNSVSLSSDGMTVAIGALNNDGNGSNSGHVRIYSWDGISWNQLGNDIDGEAASDASGASVSLSSDGMTVAIGASGNDGNGYFSGHVRIYQLQTFGCINPTACNYDSTANSDNGSCIYPSVGTSIISSIDSYEWQGNTYTESGAYSYTTTNVAGCDSTHTIYLNIIQSASACDSYIWNDSTYTQSGFYYDLLQLGPDIDGEAETDKSGGSVSLSSDGMTVAIGASGNDGNGSNSGHVRIYSWDGSSWNQLGNDIDGEAGGDYSGESVSLSSDGMTVAIGARYNDGNGSNSGHVRIYSWDGSSWSQLGSDIDGESAYDGSGISVSLSSDGMTVAIGAPFNDENGFNSGHVRVYSWDGSSWNQLGNDIDGEAANDLSGNSVSLSSDGMTVAIGAESNDGNGDISGHVRIYSWDGSSWSQLGSDIDGESAYDGSGASVSLSSDGMTVAIGASGNDGNSNNSGHVRIYSWDGNSWNQLGNDIDGEATSDASGFSVSLSSDGMTVAIGAPEHNGPGTTLSGHVRIYYWDGSSWNQLGSEIESEAANNLSGWSVSLSSDGMTVAIGAPFNSGNVSNSGHVRVYSIEALSLIIKNSNTGVDTQVHCDTYTWIDGITYTSSNNSATWTLTNAAGCDSVVTLDLAINNNTTGVDTQIHCDTYTWIDGNTYTSSNNTATWTLTNAAGCDSVVTLDLTIHNTSVGIDIQEQCDTYTWIDGNTYTSSNNSATWTLTNAAGCDSVVTLDLTIHNSSVGIDIQEHCDTYTWIDGNTYTSSNNTATWTLTNAAGCDSVVTLDLTIKPSPEQLIINQYWSTTFKTGDSFAYQWYLNGEALENDTTELLNFIQGGSYTVEAINSYGCKTMSEAFVIGRLERNIDTEIDFMVYPNPTKNLVFIELMEELGTEVDIIVSDLVGQTLKTIELKESNSSLIDFSIFKNGPYIITVKYPNGIQLSKTIIKY